MPPDDGDAINEKGASPRDSLLQKNIQVKAVAHFENIITAHIDASHSSVLDQSMPLKGTSHFSREQVQSMKIAPVYFGIGMVDERRSLICKDTVQLGYVRAYYVNVCQHERIETEKQID